MMHSPLFKRSGYSLIELMIGLALLSLSGVLVMNISSDSARALKDVTGSAQFNLMTSLIENKLSNEQSCTNIITTVSLGGVTLASAVDGTTCNLPVNNEYPLTVEIPATVAPYAIQEFKADYKFGSAVQISKLTVRQIAERDAGGNFQLKVSGIKLGDKNGASNTRCWVPVQILLEAKRLGIADNSQIPFKYNSTKIWIRVNKNGTPVVDACSLYPPVTVNLPECKLGEALINGGSRFECRPLDLPIKPPNLTSRKDVYSFWDKTLGIWKVIRPFCPTTHLKRVGFDANTPATNNGTAIPSISYLEGAATLTFPVYGSKCES